MRTKAKPPRGLIRGVVVRVSRYVRAYLFSFFLPSRIIYLHTFGTVSVKGSSCVCWMRRFSFAWDKTKIITLAGASRPMKYFAKLYLCVSGFFLFVVVSRTRWCLNLNSRDSIDRSEKFATFPLNVGWSVDSRNRVTHLWVLDVLLPPFNSWKIS